MLDPDVRASRQVQLGFAREGLDTIVPAIPTDLASLQLGLAHGELPALALVGGGEAEGVGLVKRARELLIAGKADVPIVCTGRGARAELFAAGADAVLSPPVYLRDVVTISRILSGVPSGRRDHLVGSLVETTGVYTLVRALCALGRSAVLTLIRGLRRGEIRFYRGEVTSAQVGLIHGQAAFHQLLLWTDARFDFSYEDIVRRAQIPMTTEELLKDAERFLEGVRESAELLSPSMVLEQDQQRVQGLGKQIPTEVYGVLRMFDGHRVLADILEDSPYRVFETLRVAQKALEIGLLRPSAERRPKASWRAVLAIEEWLVGSETREAVVERTSVFDSGPVARQGKPKFKKGKRNKRTRTPPMGAPTVAATPFAKPSAERAAAEIDWVSLVPRSIGAEVGQLAGVVPAAAQHGEINVASRDKAREKLEALMDTGKRDRIFPTELGPTELGPTELGPTERGPTEMRPTEMRPMQLGPEPSVVIREEGGHRQATAGSAAADLDADARVRQELSDADTDKPGRPPIAQAGVTVKAGLQAAEPRDEAPELVRGSLEKMRIDRALRDDAEQRTLEQTTRAHAAEEARAYASRVKAAGELKRLEAERASGGDRAAALMIATPIATPAIDADRGSMRTIVAEAITVAETSTSTVSVAETMTVVGAADTATITTTPQIVVREPMNRSRPDPARADSPVPVETEDSPSDGTPKRPTATLDTAPILRRPPSAGPEHDGPLVKQTTGEISESFKPRAEVTHGPSILIEPEPTPRGASVVAVALAPKPAPAPDDAEQRALVADLAAAHAAIAAATAKVSSSLPNGDASSSSREMIVSQVRKDAVEFTSAEEAFFSAKESHTAAVPKLESFDDLDEGYEPPKFWDRVFGRKK